MGKFPLSVSSQWFNWVNSFIFLAMEQFYPVLCCCADDWVHWVSAFQIADLFYLQNTLQKANVSHQHHPAMACHYSLLFCYWSTSLKMDKWFSLMMPKRIFFFWLDNPFVTFPFTQFTRWLPSPQVSSVICQVEFWCSVWHAPGFPSTGHGNWIFLWLWCLQTRMGGNNLVPSNHMILIYVHTDS